MMRKLLISLVAMLPLMLIYSLAYAGECNQQCQKKAVDTYFEQLSSIYRKGSKASDIDALFSSLSPSVHYEHLNYGASFNGSDWKQAFISNLNRGAYTSEQNQSIRVEQYIHGNGFVAVAYSYGLIQKNGCWTPEGDQNLLALFGLSNGQISSVKEYW
ncbi:hypothetical protein [Neptunicella sp. SCSIO 80796]|uniref:hypothetical protein n=1 Tax=Neptunicella plasticusilytica TaxID=3117012 RepID=UPI003A4DD92B